MKIKGITDEDFINYKLPSMYICTAFCDFKCDKENGESCCQNGALATLKEMDVPTESIVERYLKNPITKAICIGGLEPFEQFLDVYYFIMLLREKYHCKDTVVIYTGFYEEEIPLFVYYLSQYKNIIIKYGRFIPNQKEHYDETLGVYLASDNQYAEQIS